VIKSSAVLSILITQQNVPVLRPIKFVTSVCSFMWQLSVVLKISTFPRGYFLAHSVEYRQPYFPWGLNGPPGNTSASGVFIWLLPFLWYYRYHNNIVCLHGDNCSFRIDSARCEGAYRRNRWICAQMRTCTSLVISAARTQLSIFVKTTHFL